MSPTMKPRNQQNKHSEECENAKEEIKLNLFFLFNLMIPVFLIFVVVPQFTGGQNQTTEFFVIGVYIYTVALIIIFWYYRKKNRISRKIRDSV